MSGESTFIGETDGSLDSSSSSTPRLGRGEVIGRYVVLGEIGHGAMGVVYAAYDPELDRKVALKLLRERTRPSEARRTRLLREAQALARLSHPNVVTVFDVGTVDDGVWIAMEFVQGRTMTRWLAESPRSWRDVVEAMRRAGSGLAAAHRAGLVHRDFKPDNVMVADDDVVRVMDFGLARAGMPEPVGSGDDVSSTGNRALSLELTQDGAILGTPAYMAPEQLAGAPADARSDQYSFSVTLHEALWGRRPHKSTLPHELFAEILDRAVVPAGNGVPGWVARVVGRGLARDPKDRFSDMDALLAALDRDPSRMRRNVALVAMAGGATVMAFVVPAALEARTERACEREAAAIDAIWQYEARASLMAATTREGQVPGERVGAYAIRLLDDYAEAWRSATTKTCLAREHEPWSESEAAAAAECLREREDAMDALLEALTEQETITIEFIPNAIAALPAVDRCLDPHALAATYARGRNTNARESIVRLRRELLRITAHNTLGGYTQARALGEQALAAAEATRDSEVIAEALLRLGIAKVGVGEYSSAAKDLERSFIEAGRTSAYSTMGRAAASLIEVSGSHLDDYAASSHWADLADMTLDAAGSRGGMEEAKVLVQRASVESDFGHLDLALRSASEGLDIAESLLGSHHPFLATPLRIISVVHYQRDDLEPALVAARRAVEIEEHIYGPDHPSLAASVNQLAIVLYGRGEYARARPMFERAMQMIILARGLDHPIVAAGLTNLGALCSMLGDHAAAVAYLEEARRILMRVPEENRAILARCLANLADDRRTLGNLERAVATAEEAVAIFEAIGMHPDSRNALRTLGRTQLELGRYDEAMRAFERELAVVDDTAEVAQSIAPLIGMAEVELARGELEATDRLLDRADAGFGAKQNEPWEAWLLATRARWTWETGGDRRVALALANAAMQRYALSVSAYDRDRLATWIASHSLDR